MGKELVNVAGNGIRGINYYWTNKDKFNISDDELRQLNIEGNYAYINRAAIPYLQAVNKDLQQLGYELIVKDGYRSPEQYRLIQQKRYELDGKENTDKTLNVDRMPHADGYTLDVNLWNIEQKQEADLWDKSDWPQAIFVDYYRNSDDYRSKEYQKLQDLLISTMETHGFHLGSKKEIWHFELDDELR